MMRRVREVVLELFESVDGEVGRDDGEAGTLLQAVLQEIADLAAPPIVVNRA
jgi:hypothetical protein